VPIGLCLRVVADVPEEVPKPLMDGAIPRVKLIEAPAESQVLEGPVILDGLAEEVTSLEHHGPRKGHALNLTASAGRVASPLAARPRG